MVSNLFTRKTGKCLFLVLVPLFGTSIPFQRAITFFSGWIFLGLCFIAEGCTAVTIESEYWRQGLYVTFWKLCHPISVCVTAQTSRAPSYQALAHNSIKLCHRKTCLLILVILLLKEGLVNNTPAKPSFGMTRTIVLCCLSRLYFTVGVILIEGLAGLIPGKPSFGMTTLTRP